MSNLTVIEEQFPAGWQSHLKQVRNLYCMTHIDGEKITAYGTTWEINSGSETKASEWDIPLVLDDQRINPEEYTIGSCYQCM